MTSVNKIKKNTGIDYVRIVDVSFTQLHIRIVKKHLNFPLEYLTRVLTFQRHFPSEKYFSNGMIKPAPQKNRCPPFYQRCSVRRGAFRPSTSATAYRCMSVSKQGDYPLHLISDNNIVDLTTSIIPGCSCTK